MTVDGIERTLAKLDDLERKVQQTIIRKGLRAGAKLVAARARADAPVKTGRLAAAVKVRGGGTRRGRTAVAIGVGKRDFQGEAWYAAAVVYGHFAGSRQSQHFRTFVAGNNFLAAALAEESAAAVGAAEAVWAAEIQAQCKE